MVSKVNNNVPVFPVLPVLIFSTENWTLFVFKGVAKQPEKYHLVSNRGNVCKILNNNNQSIYGIEEGGTDNKNSLRVRHAYIMNSNEQLETTFVIVTGHTESELPRLICPSSVLHVEIPGVCISALQYLCLQYVGYLVFIVQKYAKSKKY